MPVQQFRLPDPGEGLTEAEIVTWRVAKGDTVKVNDIVVEIETAKSLVELPVPFAGLVTAKSVEPGILAAPGVPLLALERDGTYRLEASVEESRLSVIRVGQPVRVKLGSVDRLLEARVSEIGPVVDSLSRSYIIKIDLPALPVIRSGSFGRALFELGSRSVLTVPAAAVTDRGQLRSVLVAENSLARTRLITLGQRVGDRVEVLSGLNAGDAVVISATREIADGTRVEVRP
jgi:RND family efflux transporter MFP subunit